MQQHNDGASLASGPEVPAGGSGRGGGMRRRLITRDLTTGSIPRNLWGLAWPQVIEGAMRVAQQFMDLFWAGFLGTRSIAGVGVAQQYVQLVWTGRQGIDTSTRAMVSRAIGQGDSALANHIVFQGATVSVIFLFFISAVGIFFTEPLLRFLGVSDAIVDSAAPYMRIQFMGQGILGLQMYTGNALAAAGDTITPMRSTVVSRVLQMVASPFLVFGLMGIPAMGLAGLSIASSLANIAGLVINTRALLRGTSRLHLRWADYRVDLRLMLQMLKVGGPAAINGAERSIAQLIVVGLVSPFGDTALAAYTLTRRLEMFVNLGSQGMGQASGIIVGQSLGAGKPERAKQTVLWAAGYVVTIKAIMAVLVFVFPRQVLGIFAHDAELLDIATAWVRIQAVGYLALGVSQVGMQSFQTAGDTLFPMLVTLVSIWGVQQPLAYYLPQHFGLGQLGVAWAITIAVMVRPLCYIPYFFWGPWMKKQPLGRAPGAAPPGALAVAAAEDVARAGVGRP